MKKVKFLIFTDLHYHSEIFIHDAPGYLRSILGRAYGDGAEFIMQLGDMLHVPEKNGWLADVYKRAELPTFGAIGNHENDEAPLSEILRLQKLENNYYFYDFSGFRFIVLDPNYCKSEGEYIHFAPEAARSEDFDYIPPDQLSWLAETIENSKYPCVLFSHQSLERTDGIKNRDEAWRLISAANRNRPYSVVMCVNGHYHCDYCTIVDGVCCLDLNSTAYHWTDPENSYYPAELYEKYPFLRHVITYDAPLSALITITSDETADRGFRIDVEGSRCGFMFDPTPEELLRIDTRRLSYARRCVPYIGSYQINLHDERITRK